ncbi:restriction endonuclease subunit S [Mesorhizobium sp. B2-1-8]|uniref:restriction endonuclease subunit S n=1 Tax=Mesorhizobium sp. B2-1-8 TaxID=2589967 RepID=UPI00112B2DE3|nr:restriction endonuclease subunit S [Mesorhizobium sp. B2-1-8]UCI21339.1 restriction endonuclease subunit S [Mesorhizobium sp. B2-1-8]
MTSFDTFLTDHLDLWTSAIARRSSAGRGRSKKFSLYGVGKLRGLILDLAVRGKLVQQYPEDEPASELIKRIKTAKKRLVAENRVKQPRDFTDGDAVEAPFSIPESWMWVRLDAVGAIVGGGTPSAIDPENFAEPGSGFPWITPADLGGYTDLYITRGSRDLSEKGLSKSSATVLPKETVLFTSRAPIGYVAIASNPIATNQGFKSVVPYISDSSQYIALALRAFAHEINERAPSTTFKEVSGKIVAAVPFPLPPLSEQHRIVAKVEELMAVCDRLQAGTYATIEAHQLMVTELLATLTASRDATELVDNWARIEAHFDTLFATEDSVDQLKQTILQLAVMGRLVPQNPKDEPASELLKRIKVDWTRQVSERGIRGAKVPTFLARDAENYTYPETWKLVPLGQLSVVTDPNPSHRYPDYDGGTVPLLSTQEFSGEDDWNYSTAKLTTEAFWQFQQEICAFADGDIIFARKGRLGLPRFLPPIDRYTFSHTLFVIKPMAGVDPKYLLWFLRRQQTVDWLTNEMNQNTGVPTLGKAKTERLPVPLPPLSEQKRIIAKIEKLMNLCDALKSRLGQIDETSVQFADAIVANAVA